MTRLFSMMLTVAALAGDPSTVTGVWQVGLQGDHVVPVGLELKQDGTTVTGRILMPSNHGDRREIELAGSFIDGKLTLASTTEVSLKMHDRDEKTKLRLEGRMEKDGTMSGTFMDTMPWTAERLGGGR
ncbi:MAG TPA: hypothetical protein VKH42_14115 [Vicinamibacterales bacterium]|nr:hypothetical protein [Vicinamibacterales bacterium]